MSLIRSAWASGEATSTKSAAQQILIEIRARMSVRCIFGVEEAREPTHAVGAVDDAFSGIADVRIGDLIGRDGVIGLDVGATDDSGDVHELIALVEFQGLVSLHYQIAVGLHFHHRHRQTAGQAVALRARALSVETALTRQSRGENWHTRGRDGAT